MIFHHYHCARVYVFRAAAHIPNTRYEDEHEEGEKEEGANGEVGEEEDEQSVPYSDSFSSGHQVTIYCHLFFALAHFTLVLHYLEPGRVY